MAFHHAIVLTGGIATGKSTVSASLKEQGFDIIDADKVAHEMLDEHSDGITALFGEGYVKDGVVLRKELAKIIFSKPKNRQKLENFLHPLIKEEIESLAQIFEKLQKPYIIDIPLFFETKNYDIKEVALVYAPLKVQRERLMKRDDFTQEEANNRLNAQISIELKKAGSSFVIDNSKDLKHLAEEVKKFITYIRNRA